MGRMEYGIKWFEIMQIGVYWILGMWLIVLSYEDWKTRKVSIKVLLAGGIVIIVNLIITIVILILFNKDYCVQFYQLKYFLVSHLGGMLCGAIFLVVSKISKEHLGYGDSILMTLLGSYLGLEEFIMVMCIALALCFVGGIIGKWYKGMNTFPMIPYISAGYIIGGILG